MLASRGDFYQSDGNYEVWLKVIPNLAMHCNVYLIGGGKDFKDYLQNKYNEIDIETLTFILDNDDNSLKTYG